MQKTRSKLAVGRETVRILHSSHLHNVAGGQSGGHITLANGVNPPPNTTTKQPISILTE